MKTEMSERSRSVIAGVTATAISVLLVVSLTEALNPALILSKGPQVEAGRIAAVAGGDDAAYGIRA